MLARRPIIALLVALALSSVSVKAYLAGGIDLATAGIRFLVAFVVAWIGVTILGLVVAGYGSVPPVANDTPAQPKRRRSDAESAPGEDSPPAV